MPNTKFPNILNNSLPSALAEPIIHMIGRLAQGDVKLFANPELMLSYYQLKQSFKNVFFIPGNFSFAQWHQVLMRYGKFEQQLIIGYVLRDFMKISGSWYYTDVQKKLDESGKFQNISPKVFYHAIAAPLWFSPRLIGEAGIFAEPYPYETEVFIWQSEDQGIWLLGNEDGPLPLDKPKEFLKVKPMLESQNLSIVEEWGLAYVTLHVQDTLGKVCYPDVPSTLAIANQTLEQLCRYISFCKHLSQPLVREILAKQFPEGLTHGAETRISQAEAMQFLPTIHPSQTHDEAILRLHADNPRLVLPENYTPELLDFRIKLARATSPDPKRPIQPTITILSSNPSVTETNPSVSAVIASDSEAIQNLPKDSDPANSPLTQSKPKPKPLSKATQPMKKEVEAIQPVAPILAQKAPVVKKQADNGWIKVVKRHHKGKGKGAKFMTHAEQPGMIPSTGDTVLGRDEWIEQNELQQAIDASLSIPADMPAKQIIKTNPLEEHAHIVPILRSKLGMANKQIIALVPIPYWSQAVTALEQANLLTKNNMLHLSTPGYAYVFFLLGKQGILQQAKIDSLAIDIAEQLQQLEKASLLFPATIESIFAFRKQPDLISVLKKIYSLKDNPLPAEWLEASKTNLTLLLWMVALAECDLLYPGILENLAKCQYFQAGEGDLTDFLASFIQYYEPQGTKKEQAALMQAIIPWLSERDKEYRLATMVNNCHRYMKLSSYDIHYLMLLDINNYPSPHPNFLPHIKSIMAFIAPLCSAQADYQKTISRLTKTQKKEKEDNISFLQNLALGQLHKYLGFLPPLALLEAAIRKDNYPKPNLQQTAALTTPECDAYLSVAGNFQACQAYTNLIEKIAKMPSLSLADQTGFYSLRPATAPWVSGSPLEYLTPICRLFSLPAIDAILDAEIVSVMVEKNAIIGALYETCSQLDGATSLSKEDFLLMVREAELRKSLEEQRAVMLAKPTNPTKPTKAITETVMPTSIISTVVPNHPEYRDPQAIAVYRKSLQATVPPLDARTLLKRVGFNNQSLTKKTTLLENSPVMYKACLYLNQLQLLTEASVSTILAHEEIWIDLEARGLFFGAVLAFLINCLNIKADIKAKISLLDEVFVPDWLPRETLQEATTSLPLLNWLVHLQNCELLTPNIIAGIKNQTYSWYSQEEIQAIQRDFSQLYASLPSDIKASYRQTLDEDLTGEIFKYTCLLIFERHNQGCLAKTSLFNSHPKFKSLLPELASLSIKSQSISKDIASTKNKREENKLIQAQMDIARQLTGLLGIEITEAKSQDLDLEFNFYILPLGPKNFAALTELNSPDKLERIKEEHRLMLPHIRINKALDTMKLLPKTDLILSSLMKLPLQQQKRANPEEDFNPGKDYRISYALLFPFNQLLLLLFQQDILEGDVITLLANHQNIDGLYEACAAAPKPLSKEVFHNLAKACAATEVVSIQPSMDLMLFAPPPAATAATLADSTPTLLPPE